jgi:2-polyprenyl-3-methyl-5-hydroxy-6-metoxy-1,4-benzoquinol methylase
MLAHVPVVGSYLDIGCGAGRFGGQLKSRSPGAEVWGVEPVREAASAAASRIDRVVAGSFPDCSVDIGRTFECVICNDVLEHMVDPWSALGVIRNLLEPSGVLVASIPNIRNFATLATLALRGRWDYVSAGVLDRTHLRFFTKATMTEMVEAGGFRVESVSGAWPLETTRMRVLGAASRLLSKSLADEGRYRQYVLVAVRTP